MGKSRKPAATHGGPDPTLDHENGMCVLPEPAGPSNAAIQEQMSSDQGEAWNADAGGMIKKFDTARSWAHKGLEAASGMSKEQSEAFGR